MRPFAHRAPGNRHPDNDDGGSTGVPVREGCDVAKHGDDSGPRVGDDEPGDDLGWDDPARNETPTERLDRNWADLLQELRVIQTGVQLLTGFLLTIPFQSRFTDLTPFAHVVYLSTLSASVIATGLLIAPVSLHRILFRRHARRVTVATAHRLAQIGMVFLGIAIVGVVLLNFDVVAGLTAGIIAAAATVVLLAGLWVALPVSIRIQDDKEDAASTRDH